MRLSKILVTLSLALLTQSTVSAQQPSSRLLNKDRPGEYIEMKDYLRGKGDELVVFVSDQSSSCLRFKELLEPLAARAGFTINYLSIDRPGRQDIDWRSPLAQQFNIFEVPYVMLYQARQKRLEGLAARKWLLETRDKLVGI